MNVNKGDEVYLIQERVDGYWTVNDNHGPHTIGTVGTGVWYVISAQTNGRVRLSCGICPNWYAEVNDLFYTYENALLECIKRGNYIEKRKEKREKRGQQV